MGEFAAASCACPPALSEIDLIAAADEESSDEVDQHLAQCMYCSTRVQEIIQLQNQLRERLFRVFCPSSDELAGYAEGVLIPLEHQRIAEHMLGCEQCAQELAMLQRITGFPPLAPMPKPLRQVRACSQAENPGWMLGGEGQIFNAGMLQIVLNVERLAGATLPRLRGTLRGGWQRGISASLLIDGRVVSSVPLNAHGEFVLEDFIPGAFSLSLRLHSYEVIVEAFRFAG